MSSKDLLICGPGVLGALVGKLWLDSNTGCTVVGQTNSDTNHEKIRSLGITPVLKADADEKKFDYVVFSAPPQGGPGSPGYVNAEGYVADVKAAVARWTGEGAFVFTGSVGVIELPKEPIEYNIDEDTPAYPVGHTPRTDTLLTCEEAVTGAGGTVIRFAGLYHMRRGAHEMFLRMGKLGRWGGDITNTIHYEDAASMTMAVLNGQGEGPHKGKIYLGCDSHPLTYQELIDASVATGKYEGKSCNFTAESATGPLKKITNPKSRKALNWEPKYKSLPSFMAAGGEDWYSETGIFTEGEGVKK